MKALLVNPPIKNIINSGIPNYVDEDSGFFPPLGLMYLASYAKLHTSHEIKIFDMQVEEATYEDLTNLLFKEKPDVVAITVMTFTILDAIKTAETIKSFDSSIKVVFGGPHPHIFPDETVNLNFVDYVVIGEGEITFSELLDNLLDPEKLLHVKGLVFKNNGQIVHTGIRDFIEDLDSLPFPARELIPYQKYFSIIAKSNPITTIFTSRGCPYQCIFCYRPHMGKRFRFRSPSNVIAEIKQCVNMGIHEFLFYDDTFTINRQRVVDICNQLIEQKIQITFDIRARVNTVDEELLTLLKKAGCHRIHFGVESANPEILDVLKKGITLRQVEIAFETSKKLGIETLAYFMIGSPSETREQIEKTIRYASRLNPDYCHFSITTPYPGTPLYSMMLEKGLAHEDYWRKFAQKPISSFIPPVWEEKISRGELIDLLETAYKSFYLRPRYIMTKLVKVRSWKVFRSYIKAGLKLIIS
ncbi:MAG: radical SAM protein [Methanobacterium sp.]